MQNAEYRYKKVQIHEVQHLHRTDPKWKQQDMGDVMDLEGIHVADGREETRHSMATTTPR